MEMSKYKKVLDELYSTIEAKNHDYDSSFERTFEEFGATYIAVRLSEKVDRLKTIAKGDKTMVDESLEDTLRDIAGYSTLALTCLKDRKFAKNYVGRRLEDPVLGAIYDHYNGILTKLPAAMAFALNNIVDKEVDAGGIMIEVSTSFCTAFDEDDKEIYVSFATDKTYPEPIFSIIATYRWNQESGAHQYTIKRRTNSGDNILAEGGPI